MHRVLVAERRRRRAARPPRRAAIAFARISSLTGRDSQPLARSSPRVAGRVMARTVSKAPAATLSAPRPRAPVSNLRRRDRAPAAPPTPSVDLSGAWRVHASDGDLAPALRRPVDLATPTGRGVASRATGAATPRSRTSDGPLLYRRDLRRAAARARPPAVPRPSTASSTTATSGSTATTSARPRATSSRTRSRSPSSARRRRRRARARGRGRVPAADATAPRSARSPASSGTGTTSTRTWNPGGIWRPVRLRETGPGPHRAAARAVHRGDRGARPARCSTSRSTPAPTRTRCRSRAPARDASPDRRQRRSPTTTRDVTLAAGDNTSVVHRRRSTTRRGGGRGGSARSRCATSRSRVEVDGVPSDDRAAAHRVPRDPRATTGSSRVNGERMFPMGSNHGPTRMALAEATAPELIGATSSSRSTPTSTSCAIHAHVTRPELYDAADDAGLLLWQDLPLQWGYARGVRKEAVRQAREMVDLLGHHPSIVLWCAHNEPLAVDLQPGEPIRAARRRAQPRASMFLPTWNKDVLDRSVARALHKADPTRAVNPHSGVLPGIGERRHRHALLLRLVPRPDGRPRARRCARCRASARFVTEFGAQAVPDTADFMEPERWPDLDWDDLLRAPRAARSVYFDQHVPPALFDSFDAWRDATQALPGRAHPAADRGPPPAQVRTRPAGSATSASPTGTRPSRWSVLDHARGPEGRLRRAPRRVPDRAPDARAPRRPRPRRERAPRRRSPARSSRPTSTAAGTAGPATSPPTASPTSASSTCRPTRTDVALTLRAPDARRR